MQTIIKGIYQDRLLDPEGSLIFDLGWRSNLIVLQCRILLASLLKGDGPLGIQSMQVGRGDPSWDTAPPPPPDPNTTEEERWKKAGLQPNGQVLDPKHVQ